MLVEFGNAAALGANREPLGLRDPAVTYLHIPDSYTLEPGADVRDLALHLAQNPDITRLPDHEAFLVVVHAGGGMWNNHSAQTPRWVWSDNDELKRLLSEFYGCSAERPEDVEDTHHTWSGPPGVIPAAAVHLEGNITQNGRDLWARNMGGSQVGTTGQTTGSSATSLTNSGASWGTSPSQWLGCRVFATVSASQMVFGIVVSNTATTLTVDQWYSVTQPAGGSGNSLASGSTPSATGTYVITDGGAPAWFMGLTQNNTSPASPSTATSLTGEITTSGGGLIRKICPFAHTASANTYTLTPIFTANGSDVLPVTIAKIGVFQSMVASDSASTMLFETLLNATATLTTSGDQLTITESIVGT